MFVSAVESIITAVDPGALYQSPDHFGIAVRQTRDSNTNSEIDFDISSKIFSISEFEQPSQLTGAAVVQLVPGLP